jgi:predicted HicB family RNase H-like nuclease
MKKQEIKSLLDHYSYRVYWSDEDEEFVARCTEFPSLSGLAKSQAQALVEVRAAVEGAVMSMLDEGENVPEPLSTHKYRGEFLIRTTPEKHRDIAVRAAEAGVSVNQYVLSKIG